VPTGTPPEIVEKLRQASIDAIKSPEVQERLKAEGATPVGSEPQEFADFMKAESAFWKDLFDRTGIEMN
jgi:tripartite-type tricarboxylate transporter receptor subunit TctC